MTTMHIFKRFLPHVGIGLALVVLAIILLRAPVAPEQKVTLPLSAQDAGLPADPGEAGEATLEGIDSDGDGVRDDIQRYIALTYPDSERTRAALAQIAKALQRALIDANDESKSVMHSDENAAGAACLKAMVGNFMEARRMDQALTAKVLNTRERTLAHIRYNDQLGGHVFGLIEGQSHCDFNPDKLEN